MYISAAGIPMIFLNDHKAFNDLLYNRGDIYSDKPRMVMTGELCGAEYMVRPFPIIGPDLFFCGVWRPADGLLYPLLRSHSRVPETE